MHPMHVIFSSSGEASSTVWALGRDRISFTSEIKVLSLAIMVVVFQGLRFNILNKIHCLGYGVGARRAYVL